MKKLALVLVLAVMCPPLSASSFTRLGGGDTGPELDPNGVVRWCIDDICLVSYQNLPSGARMDWNDCGGEPMSPDRATCCLGVYEDKHYTCWRRSKPTQTSLEHFGCYDGLPVWPLPQEEGDKNCATWPESWPLPSAVLGYTTCRDEEELSFENCLNGGSEF